MNQLTVITTYYENYDHLDLFITQFNKLINENLPLKLIIVDDGSTKYPAVDICQRHNCNNISLYVVTEDLGFNSHGCRNLAMTESQTHWNILVDSDIELHSLQIPKIINLPLLETEIYQWGTNMLLINKDQFFSCKGYDEEFVNIHYGDRLFLNYINSKYTPQYFNFPINYLRAKRPVIFSEHIEKTIYDQCAIIQPHVPNIIQLIQVVKDRYKSNNFDTKKIIQFQYQRIL